MKRALLIGGGVIVAIVIAVAYYLYSSLDSIVAAAIEKYGSQYTGTQVHVDGVDLDLTSGKGAITGFSVANPAGFATPKAIEVGKIALAVDIGSVTGNPIVVKEIRVDKPKVTYEIGPDGNNIDAIAKHVESQTGSGGGGSAGKGSSEGGGGTKLVIDDLYVNGGEVGVSATALKGKTMSADLGDVHLENIGKDEGGASPGKVAGIITASLVKMVGVAIETVDLGDIMKVIGGNTEGVPMKAKELGETVGKDAEKAGEAIGKGAGEAGDKLKSLFK
jgi:uncharacterized protein involved in outer membrane biogenesis